jgi:hypothetical protein
VAERYSNRHGERAPSRGPAFDSEAPVVGCFRVVLRKGAPASAIRIWLGHPIDPDTGEEMTERGYRWQAELNGAPVDLYNYWPACAREPISRHEHDRIVERNRTMDADSPFYDARKPVDLRSAPPPAW